MFVTWKFMHSNRIVNRQIFRASLKFLLADIVYNS